MFSLPKAKLRSVDYKISVPIFKTKVVWLVRLYGFLGVITARKLDDLLAGATDVIIKTRRLLPFACNRSISRLFTFAMLVLAPLLSLSPSCMQWSSRGPANRVITTTLALRRLAKRSTATFLITRVSSPIINAAR